jgi:ribosomal protein S18 acetylase RimI-like enzyme
VVPQARGVGIGSALLHALFERALSQDLTRLSLSVEDENPARHLYQRLGFVVVGRLGSSDIMLVTLDD